MLLIVGSVVTQDNCKPILSFNLEKLLLEPGELISWIIVYTPHIHIHVVTCVGIESYDSGASRQSLAIF